MGKYIEPVAAGIGGIPLKRKGNVLVVKGNGRIHGVRAVGSLRLIKIGTKLKRRLKKLKPQETLY